MIPHILEITENEFGYVYLTSQRTLCASFKINSIDLETSHPYQIENQLEFLLKQIPTDLIVKFHLRSNIQFVPINGISRANAAKQLGSTKNTVFIHFQLSIDSFSKGSINLLRSFLRKSSDEYFYDDSIRKLIEKIPFDLFKSSGLELLPVDLETIKSFFPDKAKPISIANSSLLVNGLYTGVIKLKKLGNQRVSALTLAQKRESFPANYEIITTINRISSVQIRMLLGQRKKQESGLIGQASEEKIIASDEALAGVENRGDAYFFIESHIVLQRQSESELMRDLNHVQQELFELGEYIVETTKGALPSYLSTIPGSITHLLKRIFEKDQNLTAYLPIFTRGQNTISPTNTSLMFHRYDYSCDFFDPFDKNKTNSMFNIIGRAGRGKSVLVNLIINSIANDPESKIIVVDVKGSHTKTMMDIGGRVHHISLDTPSSVNPFKHLSTTSTEEGVEILRTFVAELLLDNGEKELPTKDTYYLDEALLSYAEAKPGSPSLSDFIKFVFSAKEHSKFPMFPRKEHLLRFSSTGINKNIFSKHNANSDDRIQYYNIDEIMQASNKTIAKATMAAIMAEFSFQLLNKKSSEKLLFLADEVPFFVEQCFSSFTLLSKNVRKLRGSLGLVAQTSNSLIVGGDRSLINNAETNILFSTDGDSETFSSVFQITPEETELVSKLKTEIGKYSQFYIRDSVSGKVGFLIINDEEYWQTTTHPADLVMIEKLKEALPQVPQNKIAKLITIAKQECGGFL